MVIKKSQKLIVFTMATNPVVYKYGIPIDQVQEITRPGRITKIPGASAYIRGSMRLRGSLLKLVDIKKRFYFGNTVVKDTTKIVVVQADGFKYGLIIDDILEIILLAAVDVEPAPSFAGGIGFKYITGLGRVNDQLIIILDLAKILTETPRPLLETGEFHIAYKGG